MDKTLFMQDAKTLIIQSKKCAKIQLMLRLVTKHFLFITNKGGLLLHETIYHKLIEFRDLLSLRITTSGIWCDCAPNMKITYTPHVFLTKTQQHNYLLYLNNLELAVCMYTRLYSDYIQSFNYLSSKLNDNVTYIIFSYITTIPIHKHEAGNTTTTTRLQAPPQLLHKTGVWTTRQY